MILYFNNGTSLVANDFDHARLLANILYVKEIKTDDNMLILGDEIEKYLFRNPEYALEQLCKFAHHDYESLPADYIDNYKKIILDALNSQQK